MFYEVIPTKIFRQASGVLTYSSSLELKPGHLVRIPLGQNTVSGIVLKKVPPVDFPTKPIEKLLYPTPLPKHLLRSLLWLSDYYLTPLPALASLILPIGLEKTRRAKAGAGLNASSSSARTSTAAKVLLNSHQRQAIADLKSAPTSTKLLYGITGSGKTNIYLHLTAEAISRGHSVILLVPEISLTSQLVQIFCSTFAQEITLIHSQQTESERHQIWAKLLGSTQPEIVIGPRSALFAPLHNLGLIIIDEAHESSYYQENSPRYSSLRLASFIASSEHIDCIFGSATPLVTDYYLAKNKNSLITLSQKAKSSAITPDIHLLSLASSSPQPSATFRKNRYFSDQLLAAIERNLKSGHQTLIFHNRRGSSPLTICEKCGWQALCPHCLLPLTLHSDTFSLICHTCDFSIPLPHSCPDCGHPAIIHKGFGTKLLEAELHKLFQDAKIIRFDTDNKKSESLSQLYDKVKDGEYQIIIGTQTIAKGLDLPQLATVGIVQADAGLSLPDYSAEERCFELITQVIGRVGRGHLNVADVFIQTYQPTHPAITHALTADYPAFADYLLKKRRQALLPPFTYLAKLSLSYKTEAITIKKIRELHQALLRQGSQQLKLTPPTPSFHEQDSHGFTWQLIIKSSSRSALLSTIKSLPAPLTAKLKISLDPPSLL